MIAFYWVFVKIIATDFLKYHLSFFPIRYYLIRYSKFLIWGKTLMKRRTFSEMAKLMTWMKTMFLFCSEERRSYLGILQSGSRSAASRGWVYCRYWIYMTQQLEYFQRQWIGWNLFVWGHWTMKIHKNNYSVFTIYLMGCSLCCCFATGNLWFLSASLTLFFFLLF